MPEDEIRGDILHAYSRLDVHQLELFLRLRSLPATGSHADLAARLTEHDLKIYVKPTSKPCTARQDVQLVPRIPHPQILSHLPLDLITEILDHLGSWELSKAVGVPTSLPRPPSWAASATPLDYAILSTSLDRVRQTPTSPPFTQVGAHLLIMFDLLDLLDYLWSLEYLRPSFKKHYEADFCLIPTLASKYNRPRILDWWRAQSDICPKAHTSDAVDAACRNISLAALEWWNANTRLASHAYPKCPCERANPDCSPILSFPPAYTSKSLESASLKVYNILSFPPVYTSKSLEYASLKAHISVLSFFTAHDWPLLPGRSLDMASSAGHVTVLDWWAYESGLEIGKDVKYDKNAVYHASCAGKVEVLEWWKEQSERGKGKGGKGVQIIFDGDALVGATRHNKPEVGLVSGMPPCH